MKKLLLLPLIAFIFLCSCKSSSFTTQRYTKLGHKHSSPKNELRASKNNRTVDDAKNEEALGVKSEKSEQLLIQASAYSQSVKSPAQAKPVFLPKRLIKPLINSGNKALTAIQSDYKTTNSVSIDQQKTSKHKLQKAAGLFDTLFKIVLFAIILAILVAIIIILVLT
ncbi:hypothetical protein CNR22_07890 [Sphingobacteriaceae bacterium]|nr:hypothetical protein CNR22_07890 [Sphingobacteriaceae bacterium]